ncbi:MAG: Maf family protein [Bacteroidetes bacterium]|nr:Maf family protein [Bacteroidota bacterium]MCL5267565.1 Maf family protein [Bacteroidota bacterium]
MKLPHIYLASRSPRRRQMLEMVGIQFTLIDIEVDEDNHFADNPREYVITLSGKKAEEAAKRISEGIVATADTIVYLDGKILNKPVDEEDAKRMLRLLSGRTHQVYSGFTLLSIPDGRTVQDCGITDVTFRKLDQEEIEEYVQSGAPMDKAGAYGIQDDLSALFVEKINGDFYNVVGLPLPRFYLALRNFRNA